jgi:hypothetical protein
VTGSSDAELRIWKLIFRDLDNEGSSAGIEPNLKKLKILDDDSKEEDDEDDFDAGHLKIERLGSVLRQSQDRVSHILIDTSGRFFKLVRRCFDCKASVQSFLFAATYLV